MRELTLLNFNEMKYGIWRDEFHSIENVSAIHWFSPEPGYIAGMSSVNGRTVTLFDLSACLGFPPLSRKRADYIAILLPYKKKYAGFLVDFVIEGFSISDKQLFAMPAYLRTAVVDSCVGQNSEFDEITSVINIPHLFEMVLKTDFKPPSVAFQISEIQQSTKTEMQTVRVFTSGGKTFAIPASSAEKVSQTPEVVSKMDFLPPFIKGVTLYNEEIIPLIHLAICLKMPEGSDGQMLVSDISGNKFGLLVDSDKGQLETANLSVRSLPAMAKSDWLVNAIINSEENIPQVIPLIDLGALLAAGSDTLEKVSLYHEYQTDSDFDKLYRKSEVGIQEFSLFGINHAIPQAEVEDTLKLIPYRPIPGGIPMLAGIAEYQDDLLPVLDLGVCFGSQSVVTQKWQMILLKNGNFRALLLVENILSERLLPLTMQHQLPFGDSLSLVYGCYPDGVEVRLILNIAAMAVNFEKTNFKNFFNAFAVDDKTKPEASEYFPSSEIHEEIQSGFEPVELITSSKVLAETDVTEKTDVAAPEPFEEADEPEAVISDNNQSVNETTDLHPDISDKEDIEPDVLEDIYSESGMNALEEILESINDAISESDLPITNLYADDEVLFDKLSSSFDDADVATVPDITDEDTDLFEKLNNAFDSSEDQAIEAATEDFQDVITEILDNDGEVVTEGESLFQLEPTMEIMADEPEESIDLVEFADSMDEDNVEFEEIDSIIESEPELESQETSDAIESIDIESELIAKAVEKTDEETETREFAEDIYESETEEFPEFKTSVIDPMLEKKFAEPGLAGDIKDFIEQDKSEFQEEAGEDLDDAKEIENPLPDYYFLKTHNGKKSKTRKKLAVFSAILISVLLILFYLFNRSDDPVPIREELKIHPRSASVQIRPVQEPEIPMVHENHQEVQPVSDASAVKEKISAVPDSIVNNQYLTLKPSKSIDHDQSSEISQSPVPIEKNNAAAAKVSMQDAVSAITPELPSKSPVFSKTQSAAGDRTIYTVKKGDTLWTISKQYTGYGINYHSIAEENIIINPDLIFPEQQIEIKKE